MRYIKIKNAIISVSDKTNLESLISYFEKNKISIYSTGGTYKFLKDFKKRITLHNISDYTNFPELLDGRVKTLHPNIHSGILAKKNISKHLSELGKRNLVFFDLVIVNLYQFEKVISQDSKNEEICLENIDIGGPTMLRAAAKNYPNVIVLSDPVQYSEFLEISKRNPKGFSLNYRRRLATEVFKSTAYYDSIISNWFSIKENNETSKISTIPIKQATKLRYGENPHQKATLYSIGDQPLKKLSGKELSYNNIVDSELAYELVNEFSESSCTIVKHANPCGVASSSNQLTAYKNALETDRESAFGGVVAFNKKIEKKVAIEISKLFTELVIAPKFSSDALLHLRKKKNLILIESRKKKKKNLLNLDIKSTKKFVLIQNFDTKKIQQEKISFVTNQKPKKKEFEDLIFAQIVSKYMNSNAIVLVKNKKTISLSSGQTSRVEAARIAINKLQMNDGKIIKKLGNIVLASDGFFPFPDIIELCSQNKISAIIQPGGSINDDKVIESANKNEISMVFTGIRNFKH